MASAVVSPATSNRRYHGTDSSYVLPNDAIEQDRLDAQSAAIVDMIGGFPFLARAVQATQTVRAVDVGCGTGAATLQLAATLPAATVDGLDISPVAASTRAAAPANVAWAVGNVLREDPVARDIFAPGSLNYVFSRMLFLGIDDWARYFSVVAGALAPAGVIECQDLDWKFYRARTDECLSDGWEWHQRVVSAVEKLGLSARAGSDAAQAMEKTGLEVLSVQTFEFAFVPSAKSPRSQAIGTYVRAKLVPQYPELLRKLLGTADVTGDELARLTEQCLRDIGSEEGVHQKYTVTVARKRQL